VNAALGLPIGRQEDLEGVLVLDRQDDQGLTEIHAKLGKCVVEHLAKLFELGSELSGLAFAGIAHDPEIGGSYLHPVVFRGGC